MQLKRAIDTSEKNAKFWKLDTLNLQTYWCEYVSKLLAVSKTEPSLNSSSATSPWLLTTGIGSEWNSFPVGLKLGSIENLRTVFVIFNRVCKMEYGFMLQQPNSPHTKKKTMSCSRIIMNNSIFYVRKTNIAWTMKTREKRSKKDSV